MKEGDLKEWQDYVLGRAKKRLLKEGRVYPMAFVLTQKMNIDANVRARCRSVDDWRPMTDDGTNPRQHTILCMPLSYDGPKELFGYMEFVERSRPPEDGPSLKELIQLGHRMGHKDPEGFLWKQLSEKYGLDGKDICHRFLRRLCLATEAEAIIKVDEVWYRRAPDPLPEGSLANDPLAEEMLFCMLESPGLLRALQLPFARTTRATGKVSGFSEVYEVVSRPDSEKQFAGRFVGFLPQNEKLCAQPS